MGLTGNFGMPHTHFQHRYLDHLPAVGALPRPQLTLMSHKAQCLFEAATSNKEFMVNVLLS